MDRAGFGGAGGGMKGIRSITYLDSNVLITYPRDEIRGLTLSRSLKITEEKELSFEAGADAKRTWELNVYINNKEVFSKTIEGGDSKQQWQKIKIDLTAFKGWTVLIRLYQRVLVVGKEAGDAYWNNL